VDVVCTWQYRPWADSIKPSPQHFQFCRFGLSIGILIFSILLPHQRCLCHVEDGKSRVVHLIKDVIFPILKDSSTRHYCCVCLILKFQLFGFFELVGSNIPTRIMFNRPKDLLPAFLIIFFCLTPYLWYVGFITSDPL
jgi:hypothetical protein